MALLGQPQEWPGQGGHSSRALDLGLCLLLCPCALLICQDGGSFVAGDLGAAGAVY